VPKTLLAVDDSVTMRKVLEITFSGDDYRVVTAEGRDSALAHLATDVDAIVLDTSLGPAEDAYALAKELRTRAPRAAIVLLSSRFNPYDPGRGRDSGADDYMDKPFETEKLLDKVARAIDARASATIAAPAAAAPAGPYRTPEPMVAIPAATGSSPKASQPTPAGGIPAQQPPPQRAATMMFQGAPPPAVGAAPGAPIPPAPPTSPVMARPPAAPAQAPSVARPEAPAASAHLQKAVADLGLTPAQVEAVLALTKEVVERAVWEVVPALAETLIKEEIARLTKA
jgi:CheY-like chemotaxis protein